MANGWHLLARIADCQITTLEFQGVSSSFCQCVDPDLRWRPADDPQPRILPVLPFGFARLGQLFRSSVLPMPEGMASKPGLRLHIWLSSAARFGALNLALMHGQTISSLM